MRPTTRAHPPLAYLDSAFIESDEARPLRIIAEYLDPLATFRRERVHDTVVFFGSARIRPDGPLGRYYEEARVLARELTLWSKGLASHAHRYIVCSGGGGGIMEAANRGASEAGVGGRYRAFARGIRSWSSSDGSRGLLTERLNCRRR